MTFAVYPNNLFKKKKTLLKRNLLTYFVSNQKDIHKYLNILFL